MLTTPSIVEFDTSLPDTFAFRIRAAITKEDMAAMGRRMRQAFKTYDGVDILLVFLTEEAGETAANLSLDAVKAQFEALTNVRNYAVVNAPKKAGTLVEMMGTLTPVETRAFETEPQAMAWLQQQNSPVGS